MDTSLLQHGLRRDGAFTEFLSLRYARVKQECEDMSETELPTNLPRYCDMCGARMTVTDLETRGRRGQALMECSACGHKTGIGWSEGGGEIDGKTPPGEWIFAGESWSPTLKIDEEGHATYELSIHQPMQPPEIPAEAIEVGRELEQIREQFDKYGINALLEAAKFPIFAPAARARVSWRRWVDER